MMDVKLRKPQMARVMTERMRKLFGGGYWLGIVAPRGAVTSGCMGEKIRALLLKLAFWLHACCEYTTVIDLIWYSTFYHTNCCLLFYFC